MVCMVKTAGPRGQVERLSLACVVLVAAACDRDIATPTFDLAFSVGQPDLANVVEQPDLANVEQPDLAHVEHPDLSLSCTPAHHCMPGLTCCLGVCVDTTADPGNCGGCGMPCESGSNCCTSICSNPVTDVKNCGACGTLCTSPHATAGCMGRQCVIRTCDPGWADCVGGFVDGCETNILTNVNNCGGCNVVCAIPNKIPKCAGGFCQ
jgi:hypothetical protein